ncbi:MAG: hypothetical protein L0206_21005, partial [Actinobacteria bacterium]|nr:hypothetical protein [Actinomycetota bacterium]
EFLQGERPRVVAHGFASPSLRRAGGEDLVDELRIVVADEADRTAYFTFSSEMRPVLHQFRVFGSRNGLLLDEHQQTLVKLRGAPLKSHLERFVPPVVLAKQYVQNAMRNVRLFLGNDFHMEAGKHALIGAFYRAIRERTPPPIPYREILLTSRVMDAIFEQVGESPLAAGAGRAVPC